MTSAIAVAPNTLIDCAGIDVRIKGSYGKLEVTGGVLRLRARNVIVESGRRIAAIENTITPVGIELTLSGSLTVNGLLSAKNAGPGTSISVTATGGITLDRSTGTAIETTGTTQGASGGDVTLTSNGTILIGGIIDADGKTCCGESNQNSGGRVEIQAGVDVLVNRLIRAEGRHREGGQVELVANRNVTISNLNGASGEIEVNGIGVTGNGGEVVLTAGNRLEVRGAIGAAGGIGNGGGTATGGTLLLSSGCGGMLLGGPITVTGGEGDGGVLVGVSDGDLELTSTIDASGVKDGGFGGHVDLEAAGNLTVQTGGIVRATGHTSKLPFADGVGGFVNFTGCRVDLRTGTVVDASGYVGGYVAIQGTRDGLPVPSATSGDFSVRVSQGSQVVATGDTALLDGGIAVSVGQLQAGVCVNNPTLTCSLDQPTCTVGWQSYDCVFANPDTDGRLSQFQPAPTITEVAGGCAGTCASGRSAGVLAARSTGVSQCSVEKYRATAKLGNCIGIKLTQAARDGLSEAEAVTNATNACLPVLARAFARASEPFGCSGAAEDLEASLNHCITSYAADERGIFGAEDFGTESRAVRTFGKAVRCELLAHSGNPGSPEPALLARCEQNLLRRVGSDDLANVDGATALTYLDACMQGVVHLLGGGALDDCQANSFCDDGDPCTVDECVVNRLCAHRPVTCLEGSICMPGVGCPECVEDVDCSSDGDACTQDVCLAGMCEHLPEPCSETAGQCNPEVGCVECFEDLDCTDADLCTIETCLANGTCGVSHVQCPPGFACQPTTGQCIGGVAIIPGDCDGDRDLDANDTACITGCLNQPAVGGCQAADCDCSGGAVTLNDRLCQIARAGGDPVTTDRCVVVRGDANQSGTVTVSDVQAVALCRSNPTTAYDCYLAADCDCDGDVDAADESCTLQRSVNGPVTDDRCPFCPADAIMVDTTSSARVGVEGSVISISGVPLDLKIPEYRERAVPLEVAARDPASGQPYRGCQVSWRVVPAESGWIFPEAPATDANGHARAWWVAGDGTPQTAEAVLESRDGGIRTETFVANVTEEQTKQPARWVTFCPADDAGCHRRRPVDEPAIEPVAYRVDVTIDEPNDKVFVAGPVQHNHRVGIQQNSSLGKPQAFQFSVFSGKSAAVGRCIGGSTPYALCADDSECAGDGICRFGECKEQPGKLCRKDHDCRETGGQFDDDVCLPDECNCDLAKGCVVTKQLRTPEGDAPGLECGPADDGNACGIATTCTLRSTDFWTVGNEIRLQLMFEKVDDNGDGTLDNRDVVVFRATAQRLNPPGPLFRLGTIERAGRDAGEPVGALTDPDFMSGFIEQLGGDRRASCLLNPIRGVTFRNPAYVPVGGNPSLENNWVPMTDAAMFGGPGCQNERFNAAGGGFRLRVGGDFPEVGEPFRHPGRGFLSLE